MFNAMVTFNLKTYQITNAYKCSEWIVAVNALGTN